MFKITIHQAWLWNLSVYPLAQTNNQLENASKIISDITLEKIIHGLIVVAFAYGGLWAINKLINWLSEKVALKYRLSVKQSLPFLRAFTTGLAIVILLNLYLNLSANNVIAITGTVAVALGFAFKDYASSLIAGIIALFESPYQVGDRVKIGDHYGEIISYSLRGILIKTPDDNILDFGQNEKYHYIWC